MDIKKKLLGIRVLILDKHREGDFSCSKRSVTQTALTCSKSTMETAE